MSDYLEKGDFYHLRKEWMEKGASDDDNSLMKLRSAEEFSSKMGGGGGGGGRWPTGSNSGGANEVVGRMYYNSVSSSRHGVGNFSTNSTTPETTMAASVAFPFTSAQWRELERQAMIYKYMMASLPVPPHLLLPLSINFPPSMYNLRYSKNGDPEPGRCKRTDGKKWRCSRDVAPHQKYCERHLHRGRPRSRKPVEQLTNNNAEINNKKTRLDQPNKQHFAHEKSLLHFDPKADLDAPSCNRDLGLMDGPEKQWQTANEGCSIYGSTSLFHQDFVEPSNVSSFPVEVPTCFIDASASTKSPSLNLSISMASGGISDQEMARLNCCDEQDSRWLGPVSWEPSGGPLAEALGCKNPTVSSPTGVLHRTLFSHSAGSSVCSSPTFASEVAFRWLN